MKRPLVALTFVGALLVTGCSSSGSSKGSSSVTLLTHDSFATTDGIFDEFTKATGVTVKVAKGADAGVLLNQAILTAGKPEGDVLWGVDNTLLSRAVQKKVFTAYKSPALSGLNLAGVTTEPGTFLTPVDRGHVCVNADSGWFAGKGLAVPTGLEDLTKPAYKDQLVVENAATSSPGLAFLLATQAKFGAGWLDYWKQLKANGVKVADGWTTAYTVDFSGSAGKGGRPLVVSYGTSPAAEVDNGKARTVALASTCFGQTEYVGVLRGTKNLTAAQKLVDYLLGTTFQNDIAPNMYVFPLAKDAVLPAEFTSFAINPDSALTVSPADIEAHREEWLKQWSALMLS